MDARWSQHAGLNVVVASVEDGLQVLASRGIKLKADVLIAEVADKTYDLVMLPGMTRNFASFGAVTGSVPQRLH